ncbi:MFS transporter [Flavisolibacter ginsenosidimutans]|uniref:MFS transporter n=1 Tax=Flavisolibacter ginsenosidimutans TaxID=661481 RepID=A0A5B8UGQ1_9BACT|nr:MFS transporter [Flavisolibacter ginsenosidimutans]QEC55794.1 MFS transporter [Flavisolibacter ginsenosidimutans]
MEKAVKEEAFAVPKNLVEGTVYSILLTISFSHLLNDTIQSLIPSIYPLVKASFHLSFTQVGLITLVFQLAASLLQPFVGFYTDKKPQPFSLATGMGFTLIGLVCLAFSASFGWLLLSVGLIGVGSSVFHPEASKVAYMAAGPRRGLAQSIFQVGGNAGSAIGPLLAALIIVPFGQSSVAWFSILALLAIVILTGVGRWYRQNLYRIRPKNVKISSGDGMKLSRRKIGLSIAILLVLIFSKYFYLASMSSYFTFYLIDKFHISVQSSQVHLFIFLFSTAAGTLLGGPLGDRFGRKYVIWFSILGVAPFTLLLPHANLLWTTVLSVFIGFILASAFSAILVYAQELLPGKVGTVSGLFFGFAFGMGGLGSALLGALADHTSIGFVYQVCAYLPLIGLLTGFLPNIGARHVKR